MARGMMPCSSSLMEAGREMRTVTGSSECPGSPRWPGTEPRAGACLQHTSAGKKQPHNSPTAQPSKPTLNIPLSVSKPQDLGANPILRLCWIPAMLLVSSPSSRRKRHISVSGGSKHHACSYSMLSFEASTTPQLFPAPRMFFCACSLLVSGHSTLLSEF